MSFKLGSLRYHGEVHLFRKTGVTSSDEKNKSIADERSDMK